MSRRREELYRAWSEAVPDFDKGEGRDRFLAAQRRAPARKRVRALRVLLAAAAVVSVALVAWVRFTLPLSFTADGRGEVGAWLATNASNDLPVSFSDGTRVLLRPDSRGRVEHVDRGGAHVLLERGAVAADVVHRARTDWRFVAGPFEVRVTGTSLDVAWDPVAEHFEVGVARGSVIVRGPYVGADQVVREGERCIVDLAQKSMQLRTESALAHSAPVPRPIAAPPPLPAIAPVQPQPAISAAISAPAPRATTGANEPLARAHAGLSWTRLEERGEYAAAYDAVGPAGLRSLYATASAQELLRFAQVSQLTGHRDAQRESLLACRHRFRGTPQAALAAYELGRASSTTEAIPWLEAYLREEPNGTLAREASGRLVEAHALAGHGAAARDAATRYLARYPDGPSASLARRVLGQGAHDE